MKYYTTNGLIDSILRRSMVPSTQVTFTEDDFLSFLNEQMDLQVVPHILSFHEDYLLHTEFVDIIPGVTRYAVPSRAIGSKLRDISLADNSGNIYEMTRISVEDLSDSFMYSSRQFYLEGGTIVVPKDVSSTATRLMLSYYLRPNALISETLASIVTNVNYNNGLVTVDKTSPIFSLSNVYDITSSKQPHKLLAMDMTVQGLPTEDNLVFTFGTIKDVEISLPSVLGDYTDTYITVVDNSQGDADTSVFYFGVAPVVSGTLIPVDISLAVTSTDVLNSLTTIFNATFGDNRLFAAVLDATTLQIVNGGVGISVGDNFTVESSLISNTLVNSVGTVTIPTSLIPNDIIALAETTIIPQIPSELHPMLAQGAAMRCLEALGDTQGLANAATKLAEMEAKTGALIENRVESAPLKIVPRHTLIRKSTNKFRS